MTLIATAPERLPRAVLVANRGEIAVRIIRACADLGIRSIAVFSPADRDAQHVDLADEAFALKGDRAADSYLDVDQLIAIAQRAGADAVHPGYGFLAERADFAERALEEGLTWIGPSPEAIRRLGDKVQARSIAQKVGAPLVAGTPGPVHSAEEVIAFAEEHGMPIAIKAAFGGGGRGIKVVNDASIVRESFESAVREATAAFGRGDCFVEVFLAHPRHVETQCLADEHGNVRVLSTRDCSLQRRNQKLLEEAPAPTITPAQLKLLRDASVAILSEAGYSGAGTCEFLIEGDRITFLEVNTRIQVEHPVTEEVTGTDLIAAMIQVASGAFLAEEPEVRGHSLEFRINAENVTADFSPVTGLLTTIRWPEGPGVRVDSGYRQGDVVPPHYDSLLAKLIITGPDRATAIARARRALRETTIEGVPTTLDFHRQVVDEPDFTLDYGAAIYTGWIDAVFRYRGPGRETSQPPTPAGVRRIVAEVDGRRIVVTLPGTEQPESDLVAASASRRRHRPKAAMPQDAVIAPLSGSVVSISVDEGAIVAEGDLVMIMEAMKMERRITAPYAGTVTSAPVAVGASVTSGDVLFRLEPTGATE